jgi:predicted secreted protein
MKWTSILAIYLLFWVLSAFLVMPFHVRTAQEAGGELVPGQAESAPHDFKPLRITLWTTLVATVLFGLYYANYVNEWLTPAMLDFSSQS